MPDGDISVAAADHGSWSALRAGVIAGADGCCKKQARDGCPGLIVAQEPVPRLKECSGSGGRCNGPRPQMLEDRDARQQVSPGLAWNNTVDPTVPLEPLDAAATGGELASRSRGSVRALEAGLPEIRQPLREFRRGGITAPERRVV